MDDPDPPPDPLADFLIASTATPNPPRSAALPASHPHPAPDPTPPEVDLQVDGSRGAPPPGPDPPELTSMASAGDFTAPSANAIEPEGPGDGPWASDPLLWPVEGAQKQSPLSEPGSPLPKLVCDESVPPAAADGVQKPSTLTKNPGPSLQEPPGPTEGAQKSSPPTGKAGPPPQRVCGVHAHSSHTSAMPLPLPNHSAQEQSSPTDTMAPESPTAIDPEIQAQVRTLLPELAKDLNKLRTLKGPRAVCTGGGSAINPLPGKAHTNPEDTTRNPQEDLELQDALLKTRIPAIQKGKRALMEAGIHGEQPNSSYKPATASTVNSPTHKDEAAMSIHFWATEEGWEPTKTYHRRRQNSERTSAHGKLQSGDRALGSVFFKSKMEGRCFNCFSPNHIAPSGHRPPRCWRCFHSGHRAKDCPPIPL